MPVNPWFTSTLDLAIVVCLFVWRPRLHNEPAAMRFRAGALFTAWLLIGAGAMYALATFTDTTLCGAGEILGDGKIVVLNPETWVGNRCPLLNYTPTIGDNLKTGKWFVLLYHDQCPVCRRIVDQLPRITASFGKRQVALIEMPPYGDCRIPLRSREITAIHGRLDDSREWVAETPQAIMLDDGIVLGTRSKDRLVEDLQRALADCGASGASCLVQVPDRGPSFPGSL